MVANDYFCSAEVLYMGAAVGGDIGWKVLSAHSGANVFIR